MNPAYTKALSVLGLNASGQQDSDSNSSGSASDISEKDIRRAYAKLIKTEARPDTNPEKFAEVRKAYDTALAIFKEQQKKQKDSSSAQEQSPKGELGSITSSVPVIPALDLSDESEQRSKRVSSLIDDIEIAESNEETNSDSSSAADSSSKGFSDVGKAEVETVAEAELEAKTETETETEPEPEQEAKTEPEPEPIDSTDTDTDTDSPIVTQSDAADKDDAAEVEIPKVVESHQSKIAEPDRVSVTPEVTHFDTSHSQIGADSSDSSTNDESEIRSRIEKIQSLLSANESVDKNVETELLQLLDKVLALGKNRSAIQEQINLEQLAADISEQKSAPYSLVKKLVVELDLDGVNVLSSAPRSFGKLHKKYNDMLEVGAFMQRAKKRGEFEHHFINGGKPPYKKKGFPTEEDKKKYGQTALWLMMCSPPRTDLIHPDSELIARGEYVAPVSNHSTLQTPVEKGGGNFRLIFAVMVILGGIIYRLANFEMPESASDRMIDDIMAQTAERRLQSVTSNQNHKTNRYPQFENFKHFSDAEIGVIKFSIKEEKLQRLNDDMGSKEFSKFISENKKYLTEWRLLVDSDADVKYRTNIAILERLDGESRIRNQTIEMDTGLKIRIRNGRYTFREPE